MDAMDFVTATLHAIDGAPLADEKVRRMVIASAEALAERSGVRLVRVTATDTSLEAVLEAEEVVAVGFAAELRRSTNDWWAAKSGGEVLWAEGEA